MNSKERRLHQQNMKIYKNLSSKILTIDNFRKAYKNATKGKKFYRDVKVIERIGRNKYLNKLCDDVSLAYKLKKFSKIIK